MLRKIIIISLVTALAVAARGQEVPHPGASLVPLEKKQASESIPKTPSYPGKVEQNSSHKSIPTWVLRIPRDRMDPIKADLPLITTAAEFLRKNPDAKMTVIGHAGGDGTEEYNLALGERRSTAVQQLLVALGVEPARLKVLTGGAARPYSVSANGRKTYQPHRVELVIR